MRIKSLKNILYSNFLKTTLIPLFVIEVSLLILYFGISNFLVDNSKNLLSKEIKNNLINISKNETKDINSQLKEISSLGSLLQYEQQNVFKNKEEVLKKVKQPDFKFAKNGVFYKIKDDGGASLFYASTTNINKEQKQKAILTEVFDENLKYSVDRNELIVASYFNSYDDMNRLYPFIKEVYLQYPSDIHMENYNFYYKADKKHNPDKKPVWTSAYLDPAGQGWMVSCVVPIYNNEFLEGVTGLDVTIDKFIKTVLNLDLPWNATAMLVDQNGMILAMPKDIENILNIKELNDHTYSDVIKDTNLKPDEFNIYKNKKLNKYFNEFTNKKQQLIEKRINNHDYLITQSNIEQTNWKLFTFVDKEMIFEPVNEIEIISNEIGMVAILGMFIFYLIFFVFLNKKVKSISNNISTPISRLASLTKNFNAKTKISNPINTNIKEIDSLSNNFYKMTNEIYEKRQKLEELNISLEERVQKEVKKNREKDQLILRQSKLAQMGEMISMIAHQWRQPLATIGSIVVNIKLKLALKKFDLSDENQREKFVEFLQKEFTNIEKFVGVLSTTIDDFRDFYKPTKEAKEVSLSKICKKAISILEPELKNDNITLIEDFKCTKTHILYENELIQVLLNLIKNAIDNFKITENRNKTLEVCTISENDSLKIKVKDNAGGISDEIKDKIFEPYFSTKDDKNGTGLGLYMSKVLIEQYQDGQLYFKNRNDGVEFTIELKR
ncbi:MAG: ATP-binding protein [Campylobacterota bacterium]